MKLAKISFTNFKGATASYNLTAITIFVGLNFRGKTRVMDAIRLSLLGFLPELGKAAASTWGLSSGSDMEVQAEFDDGTVIRRGWKLKGDSVVKSEELPDMARFGDLTVMMNAETYFALSDRKRVEYVAAHCPGSADTNAHGIQTRVLGTLMEQFEADPTRAFVLHLEKLTAGRSHANAQEFLDAQIEAADQIVKVSKQHADIQQKTIVGLSHLRAQDDPTTSMGALESQRAQINTDIATLTEKRGGFMADFTQMKADDARRATIERELRFADKNRQEHRDLTAKLALIDAELVNAQAPEVADVLALQRESTALESRRAVIINNQQTAEAAKVLAINAEDQVDAATACPYCGATGDGWKKIKLAELAQEIDARKEVLAKMASDKLLIEDQINTLIFKISAAKDASYKIGQLNTSKVTVNQQLATLATTLARLDTLTEELGRLRTNDPKLTTNVEVLQTELNIKQQELRGIDGQIREGMGRSHELQRLAEAEKERDQANAEQEVAKAAAKELRAIQSELVAAAFKPLLDIANSFFGSVLQTPLAYHQGEIGTWRDGLFVGHHTFSGTEKALTYAAIQMALASQSPFRLMLVDELGRMDANTLAEALFAINDAVKAGSVDQFIGASASGNGRQIAAGDSAFQVIEIQ